MKEIFEKQKKFQKFIGNDINSQKFRNEMLYAIIAEVVEAGNETTWKSWKKTQEFNKNKFVEELADVQIFLINLVISSGISWKEFQNEIEKKIKINFKRQENEY